METNLSQVGVGQRFMTPDHWERGYSGRIATVVSIVDTKYGVTIGEGNREVHYINTYSDSDSIVYPLDKVELSDEVLDFLDE